MTNNLRALTNNNTDLSTSPNAELHAQLKEACRMMAYEQQNYTRENGQQDQLAKPKIQSVSEPYPDTVYFSREEVNPIVATLIKKNLYKKHFGDGKHDICCPWGYGQNGHDAVYIEPNVSDPLGSFKCTHHHCNNRDVNNLLVLLGICNIRAQDKPIILVKEGVEPIICNAAEIELSKNGRYYQRGGMIVTIYTDSITQETTVNNLTISDLHLCLANILIWLKYESRNKEYIKCDLPTKYVKLIKDRSDYQYLPELKGIARQPYFRPDGSLMMDSGYDLTTGMFGDFDSKQFKISERPTRHQAEQALKELSDLLSEFKFKTDDDLSAAMAAILTAVIRPSLPTAPMFHVNASKIGSGKSYLCETISAFATPQKGSPFAFPSDDDECTKLLLNVFLSVPTVLEFDNLTKDIPPYKTLCTSLTNESISGRIVGQSKIAKTDTRVLILSSGNNVGPIKDMTRRCVTITLDPDCEIPAARDFTKQPVNEVINDRGRFVSLVYTIILAWISAGCPKTNCKAIGSYTEWSNYCRQPLLWLGLEDPASSIFRSIANSGSI